VEQTDRHANRPVEDTIVGRLAEGMAAGDKTAEGMAVEGKLVGGPVDRVMVE
jgi:hypothetical protein